MIVEAMSRVWQQKAASLFVASLLGAFLVVLLAGCGVSSALGDPLAGGTATARAATVTTLHVIRTSVFPQNHIAPLERTVTNAATVQQLYNAMLQLPRYPS